MASRQVPEGRWKMFFERFSDAHAGFKAHVDLEKPDGRPVVRDKALLSIDARPVGGEEPNVIVVFKEFLGAETIYVIKAASAVHYDPDKDGEEEIRVECRDGRTFLLALPVSPLVAGSASWTESLREVLRR